MNHLREFTIFTPSVPLGAKMIGLRQHPSYGDCLEVKREYNQNCSVQIGFVTLGPLHHA